MGALSFHVVGFVVLRYFVGIDTQSNTMELRSLCVALPATPHLIALRFNFVCVVLRCVLISVPFRVVFKERCEVVRSVLNAP